MTARAAPARVAATLRSIAATLPSQESDRDTVTGERGTEDTKDAWPHRTGTGTGAIRPSRRPRRPRLLAISGAGVLAVIGAVTGIILATASPSHPNATAPRAPTYRLLRSLANPGNGKYSVRFVAFSPDGRTVAAPGSDGRTYLWDVATGQRITTLTDPKTGPYGVRSVVFSPDGRLLVTSDSNGHAYLWDPKTGHQLTVLKDPGGISVLGVSFSPNSQLLATADQNGRTYLWKLA